MSYKTITPGDKVGKPLNARFIQSKNGTTGIEVAFEFQDSESTERLSWVGWLTDAAMEKTMETLVDVLGFNGDDRVKDDGSGILMNPQAIAYGKEVKLVVELESYVDKNGEQQQAPKIRWVNKLGGSRFAGLTPEVLKNNLGAIGFKAAFLAAKQNSGKPAQPAAPTQQSFSESDIPF